MQSLHMTNHESAWQWGTWLAGVVWLAAVLMSLWALTAAERVDDLLMRPVTSRPLPIDIRP